MDSKTKESQKKQARDNAQLHDKVHEGKAFLTKEKLEFIEKTEMAVLGQLILESDAIYQVAKDLTPEILFYPKNQIILSAILELFSKGNKIDLLTIISNIRNHGKIEESGGIAYISSLTNNVASTSHLESHVRLLQQFSLERNLYAITCENISKLLKGEEDVFDILNGLQVKLDQSLKTLSTTKISKVGDIYHQIIQESYDVIDKGISSGVPTGMRVVDNLTNGWQKSDLIIIAGRPAMGKTALAISMCIFPAMEKKIPIGIFSLEMSKAQLVGRMQAMLGKVDVSRITKKQLNYDELFNMANRTKALAEAPIYIEDSAGITINDFKAKAREMVRDFGVQLIVIDYLQLMYSGQKLQNREQEVSEISKSLKRVAKELDIPIIALSQLSRGVESRGGDKKPVLSDLRESGQIEQDADMICFCYRPEYYTLTEYEIQGDVVNTEGLFLLLVAKHRNGGLGDLPLHFEGKYTYVTNHPNYTPYSNIANAHNELNNSALELPETSSFGGGLKPNTSFETPQSNKNVNEFLKDEDEEETPF